MKPTEQAPSPRIRLNNILHVSVQKTEFELRQGYSSWPMLNIATVYLRPTSHCQAASRQGATKTTVPVIPSLMPTTMISLMLISFTESRWVHNVVFFHPEWAFWCRYRYTVKSLIIIIHVCFVVSESNAHGYRHLGWSGVKDVNVGNTDNIKRCCRQIIPSERVVKPSIATGVWMRLL